MSIEQPTTPESLYAEHKALVEKKDETIDSEFEAFRVQRSWEMSEGMYKGPFIFGDKAEEDATKRQIARKSLTVMNLDQKYKENINRSKEHLQEHPEQYE